MGEMDPEVSMYPPSQRDRSDRESAVRQQGVNIAGLQGGLRSALAAPVRASTQEADEETFGGGDSGDDSQPAWQWDDRHTVVSTGPQYKTLTYTPVEESLVVRWHPDGLGGIRLTNEWFTLVGNQVTITPPAGVVVAGDEFSFQYQFNPGTVLGDPDPDPPATRYSLDICPDVLTAVGGNPYVPKEIVGGDTALCDGSDATYTRTALSRRVDLWNDELYCEFPATVLGSTLDTIQLSIRAQFTLTGTATVRRFAAMALDGPDQTLDYLGDFEINNGGTLTTIPCSMPDGTLQDAASAAYYDYDNFPTVPYTATLAAIESGVFQIMFEVRSPFAGTANPQDYILDLFEVTLHVEGDL